MLLEAIRRIGGKRDNLQVDRNGNLYTVNALPDLAQLAAAGQLFSIDALASTAKAPVVVPPLLSPEWGLYNADPELSMVVLEVAATLKSGTAGLGLAILGASAIGDQTLVSADYAGTIKSSCNGSQNKPNVYLDDNPTLVGTQPSWRVLENTKLNSIAVNAVGSGLIAKTDGSLIAPPRGMVGVEVMGETGSSALFTVSFLVAMLKLPLS